MRENEVVVVVVEEEEDDGTDLWWLSLYGLQLRPLLLLCHMTVPELCVFMREKERGEVRQAEGR